MLKKDYFEKLISDHVVTALRETYSITVDLTEKQKYLIDNLSDRFYTLFKDCVTIDDLKEKWENEKRISNSL